MVARKPYNNYKSFRLTTGTQRSLEDSLSRMNCDQCCQNQTYSNQQSQVSLLHSIPTTSHQKPMELIPTSLPEPRNVENPSVTYNRGHRRISTKRMWELYRHRCAINSTWCTVYQRKVASFCQYTHELLPAQLSASASASCCSQRDNDEKARV